MGFHVMTINSSLSASCGIQSMHAILCDNKQKSTIISIKRSLIVSSTEIIISHDHNNNNQHLLMMIITRRRWKFRLIDDNQHLLNMIWVFGYNEHKPKNYFFQKYKYKMRITIWIVFPRICKKGILLSVIVILKPKIESSL